MLEISKSWSWTHDLAVLETTSRRNPFIFHAWVFRCITSFSHTCQTARKTFNHLRADTSKPKPKRKRSTCIHCGRGFIAVMRPNGFYTILCDKCEREFLKKHKRKW